jgi:predicted transposase YbfD/YdcC
MPIHFFVGSGKWDKGMTARRLAMSLPRKGLKRIGVAIGKTVRSGKMFSNVRYSILSQRLSGKNFAATARGHWTLENSCHWILDVTFGEDQSRIWKGHADANFSILRRTALGLLKNNHDLKMGIKNRRWRRESVTAALDPGGCVAYNLAHLVTMPPAIATRAARGGPRPPRGVGRDSSTRCPSRERSCRSRSASLPMSQGG